MGDIALGGLFVLAIAAVAVMLGAVIVLLLGLEGADSLTSGDYSSTGAVIFLAFAAFGQSGAMGLWPVIVARWKGRGVVADFGFRFKPVDLAIGGGGALGILILAGTIGMGLSTLFDIDPDESSNTQIVTDAAGTSAVWVMVIAAVVLAPLVEELFFRGLCLRAIEKRFGTPIAVIGSTILFVLPHYTFSTLAGTVVLFSIIGVVGLVLALLVVKTDRLGPAIVAHAVFNAVGVLAALSAA